MQLWSCKRRESTRTNLLSLEGEAPQGATQALQSATAAANTEPEQPGRHNPCNPLGSQCAVAAHPPCPGEFGISHPPSLNVQLLLDIREQGTKAHALCDTWCLWWHLGGWHQLSVMPGAVGPRSIQVGNLHFSSEAAAVNNPGEL